MFQICLLHSIVVVQSLNVNNAKVEKPSVQFSSVTQSCLTLCDPMDCSMPGSSVLHHLPEIAETQVH